MMAPPDSNESTSALTQRYFLALVMMAALIIMSQFLVQLFLNQQVTDAKVINLARQQRSSSQALTKLILLIINEENPSQRETWLQELSALSDTWAATHAGLEAGSADLGLSPDTAPLQPHFDRIHHATRCIIVLQNTLNDPDCTENLNSYQTVILTHEGEYRAGLETIISTFDQNYLDDINRVRWIETILLVINLGVLILIGGFVFRPALQRMVQTQKILTENEKKYRILTENANDLISRHTPDGDFLYVSPACNRLLGYQPDELMGHSFYEFLHTDDARKVKKHFAGLLDTASSITLTYRFRRKDGVYIWFETTTQSVYHPQNHQIEELIAVSRNISWRKRVEDALIQERDLMTLLMDNIPDTIYFKDNESRFTRINRAQAALLGLHRPEDAIGKTDFDFQSQELAENFHQEEQALIRSGQPIIDRLENNPTHEGLPRWFSATKVPMRNETGQIVGMVGISRDITERVKADEALKHSEARFRAMNEASPLGIFFTDAMGRCLYSNPLYQQLCGLTYEETLGDGWINAIHPEDRRRVFDEWVAAAMRQIVFSSIHRYLLPDGTILWVSEKAAPIYDEQQVVGYVGTVENITEHKKATEALEESQRFIERIAEALPDILFVYDLIEARDVYVNREVTAMLGYTAEQIQAMGASLAANIMHPDDVAVLMERNARFNDAKDGEIVETEYRIKNVVGEWQWLRSRGIVFSRLPDGTPKQVLGIAQNVTASVLAAEELQKAKLASEAANRAKSLFLANMSHELRTPLNSILGFSQLIAADSTLDREKRDHIGVIIRSGEHLLSLINNVLEVSKIEAGQITLNETSFDLHRLLNDIREMFIVRAEAKALQILLDDLSDIPPYYYGDDGKLRQVFINLLNNAIKFTQTGGVAMRVRCQVLPPQIPPDYLPANAKSIQLFFEVEDSGEGITAEELSSIFEPFVQSRSGQKAQEGTGLGLSICREFVHLLSGDITIHSEVDHGTRVNFDVKLWQLEEVIILEKEKKRRIVGLAPDQPPCRILVVEDKQENRQLLVQLMQTVGFEVAEAANGQEGVEMCERWQPHLIWMDMRMPVLNGREATQHIRQHEWGKKVVIIALTASAFEHERRLILEAGCDDLATKPFNPLDLYHKISKHLGVHFLYSDHTQIMPALPENSLLSQMAISLPADLSKALREAATILDPHRTLNIVEQIKAHDSELAETLAQWVKQFRFDKIITLLDQGELSS